MDSTLVCNKCLNKLTSEAFITECSHIFCMACAHKTAYWAHENGLKCPACPTVLPMEGYGHAADLRPSEDHKCTVLRGLSPGDVIECAAAAARFWEFQMSHQISMKSYFIEFLEAKYGNLEHELEAVEGTARRDIEMLSKKLEAVTMERDDMRKMNDELLERIKEKNKRLSQLQELYDKLKEKVMPDQPQDATAEAMDLGLGRVGVAGASPLANPTRPAFPRPSEPGSQNAGHMERRSLPRIPSGPSIPSWHTRNRVLSGTPARHATLNNTSGIGLSPVPRSGVAGSHLAAIGIGSGYAVNSQRPGSLRRGNMTLPGQGRRIAKRPAAATLDE